MQFTRAGEYAVLGMLHLARRPWGEMAMMEAVSRDERIPKSFLSKIFQDLVRAGLLRSHRGAGGGFALVKRPEETSVMEVIEAIEGRLALTRCLQEVPDCERQEGCVLCGLFEQAQDRVRDVFGRTTLADLLRQPAGRMSPASGTGAGAGQTAAGDVVLKEN